MSEVVGGRYALLRKLAEGGMAEVFLARQTGLEGFEKLVVLKRILPVHAANPDFVKMFIDEARTAADLRHPNVVSVTDVGRDAGTYFIAMEYLHGVDLSQLVARSQQLGERVPLEHALQIVADAAAGLHYAHTKQDLQGQPLAIVHRDVSPQNVLVTFDGLTKVLDFGIAHARRRGTKTDVGVVKGKYGYLSPEQLEGASLDARSDLFALGIVLWELTTLRRLFDRPSDAEVLRAVMECRVPRPSTVVPDYPPALEDVVLTALAPRREQRFADCQAFGRALEDYLDQRRLPHSPSRVSQYLKGLFPDFAREGPLSQAAPVPLAAETSTRAEKPRAPRAEQRPTRKEKPRPVPAEALGFLGEVQRFVAHGSERRTNLVPPATPFVGRDADVRAVESLLTRHRLVTVTGMGGMGKTRLAWQVAERALATPPSGGVWMVDLAEARSRDDMLKAVARALTVDVSAADTSHDSVTQTGRTLAGRGDCLLVLDNFEQLVALAPETLGAWLESAPRARFLVTSREALRLTGEKVHPLQPLALPTAEADGDAVDFFLARAKAAGFHAGLSSADAEAVKAIVRQLDGWPLALELAAARLGSLAPPVLLERLQQRFQALGGAAPEAGRHGTLWNTIDWSWQLLDASEQAALSQISTFRGGFTLEAAEAVLLLPGDRDTHDVVEALWRKSLLSAFVAPEAPGQVRLTLLESIQEFAAAKLAAVKGEARLRARHAAHYLALGDAWAEAVHGHAAEETLQLLEVERPNLNEIFERAINTAPLTAESATTALGALHALDALLSRKGPYHSHLALLDTGIEVAQRANVDPAWLGRALAERANARRQRGQLAQALAELKESLALVQAAEDRPLEGRVRGDLGLALHVTGDLEGAQEHLEASLELATEVGDEAQVVRATSQLAVVLVAREDLAEALTRCDEALLGARRRGDRVSEARALGTLGAVYLEQRQLELARAFFAEAVDHCQKVGEKRLGAFFLGRLGATFLESGELESARSCLSDAVSAFAELSDLRHEGLFLSHLAALESRAGNAAVAAVTLDAAQARLESARDPLLLTALALTRAAVTLAAGALPPDEAHRQLALAHAPQGAAPAPSTRSEEVRLAARRLGQALGAR